MDTEPTDEMRLLAHTERQTKALEDIDASLKWLLALVLFATIAFLLVALN